ncbi:MAG: FKBP-type peptidyl-prolyl cis-trans isomerase [Bacteroidales bacterium]|nr:FKBP-type peptidyl-prolyl cis-trans isomerase [Bacteroidales bacterium]
MRRTIEIVIAAALLLIAASCGKKQMETTYDKQESNIEAIVASLEKSNADATTEYNKGTVKVTVVHGNGEALEDGGAVSFYYAGFYINSTRLNNSNLFATNYDTFANSAGWALSDSSSFTISTIKLGEDDLVEGLRNGLVGVRGGDECYVLFSGKHGFGKRGIAGIPSNSALAYHLWIKSVSND